MAMTQYAGADVTYVNPIVYRDAKTIRLQETSHNDTQGVRVIKRTSRLRKGPLLLIVENIRNVRAVMRLKPDVVISNDHLMSLLLPLYCRLTKRKFIYDQLDDWLDIEKNRFVYWYTRYIAYPLFGRLAYAFINTSHFLQKKSLQFTRRSYVVANGKSEDDIRTFQQHVTDSASVVNFVSTIRDWYDYDLLIDAFAAFPEISLHLYGGGDEKVRQQIIERAANVPNVVVHDSVDSAKVPRLMGESVFGVLPFKDTSTNQAQAPIKLFDYWSAGKPVLAVPTREMEIIGTDAIVFARGVNEWKAAIASLLADTEKRHRLGDNGLNNMHTTYNYREIAAVLQTILTDSPS